MTKFPATIGGRSPHEILATTIAAMTGHADDGQATRSIELVAPTMTLGPADSGRDIETLKMVMEQREAAPYQTRHSVGWPVVYEASEERIRGRAIVTIHRLTDERYTLSAADFHVTVILQDGEWLIDHLQILPFVARRIEEGGAAPGGQLVPVDSQPRLVRTTEGWFAKAGPMVFRLAASSFAEAVEALGDGKQMPGELVAGPVPGELLAPVEPSRLFLIGLNYKSHADEFGITPPDHVVYGELPVDCIVAPGTKLVRPEEAPDQVDYEGEIAVVIGRDCSKVDLKEAADCVFAVTACNDFSARDLQMAAFMEARAAGGQPSMAKAKGFPGAKPIGPELIVVKGLDPARLDVELRTLVNGEERQKGNLSELLFPIPELISKISQDHDLKAGDVILTGTPAGVGHAKETYLKAGDAVEIVVGGMAPLASEIV
jgi:2-keto-4-pentenoate hydratase/2-oxohepta-3-ene-1,7-dioic acid hydratase in catechol pathway